MTQQSKKEGSIVDDHRNMVLVTGRVSDFQINNLKAWPQIVIPESTGTSLSFDFKVMESGKPTPEEDDFTSISNIISKKTIDAGKVTYDFKLDDGVKIDNLLEKLSQLEIWVKFLFWNETKVIFKKNGKKWNWKKTSN